MVTTMTLADVDAASSRAAAVLRSGTTVLRSTGRRTSGSDVATVVLVLIGRRGKVRGDALLLLLLVSSQGGGVQDRVRDRTVGEDHVGVALGQAGQQLDVGELVGEAVVGGGVGVVTAGWVGVVAAGWDIGGGGTTVGVARRSGWVAAAGLTTAGSRTLLGVVGDEGLGKS